MEHREEVRRLLRRPPTGLFVDIDGTIAALVATPDAVRLTPTVRRALAVLSRNLVVVVLTGRQVAPARALVGLDSITYVGNHGLEWWEDGITRTLPEAVPFIPQVHALAGALKEGLASLSGLVIEDKESSLSVHYRLARDPEVARDAILEFLTKAPESRGLTLREGKLMVEVRLPIPVDKGTALRWVVERRALRSALVLGDDSTDLDAFQAVSRLREESDFVGVAVAVIGEDAPFQLVDLSDYHLLNTNSVESFLEWLSEQSEIN